MRPKLRRCSWSAKTNWIRWFKPVATGDRFLAQELYLEIESGESNFADLENAMPKDRNATPTASWAVSLTQAHPILVEKLKVAQPGILLEPFPISDWWLVVRLERYAPATFTDEVCEQMCEEIFKAWIDEEAATILSKLSDDTLKPKPISDFSVSR